MEDWAVITDEGLTMFVNLSEEDARGIAKNETATGKAQFAVPMRVAEHAQGLWKDYHDAFERKLRKARKVRIHDLLTHGYDENYTQNMGPHCQNCGTPTAWSVARCEECVGS